MKPRRLIRETKTVEAMVKIFCQSRHKTGNDLCPACTDLLTYAKRRLDGCPFQEGKTTCAHCRIHCYKPDMKERIKEVMRFAGPRMTFRHPILSLFHLLDGASKEPVLPKKLKT